MANRSLSTFHFAKLNELLQRIVLIASAWLVAAIVSTSSAQRVQFPSPYQSAPPLVPDPNLGGASAFGQGAYLGGTIQPFDPYALPGNFGTFGTPPATSPGMAPGQFSAPPSWPGPAPSPLPGAPLGTPPAGQAPSLPPPSSPYGSPLPSGPSGLQPQPFYNGSPYATNAYGQPNTTAGGGPPYQRLFQDTGLRATYLYGSDPNDLAMTEAEASTTAYFANFLGIPNGLRVTPGFVFHWTDGPVTPEVPARLYSGYLDFGLEPQFGERFGAELTARVGIYSDFQKFSSKDSIRLLGTAVGVYQMTPTAALKLGVAYIDRVDLKLLPAAGVLWMPNPQTRWDIFFPAPKLSNYWTTLGNRQVWWYLGGEYGGGSWSIEREGSPMLGTLDRIDINDIRVYAGVEWWNLNRVYGFAEIGYVFERELVYFRVPGDSTKIGDSFMVRAGVSW